MHIKPKWISTLIFSLLLSGCAQKTKAPIEIIETKNVVTRKKVEQIDKHEQAIEKTSEVAILVPLQGDGAQLGREMSDLIKLGLQDSGYNKPINISVYDSSSLQSIHDSADEIKSKKTDLILGPTSSKLITPIHTYINAEIPIITLSNNTNLNLDNVFIFGHKPMKQTERIFAYMIQNKISTNIILVLPEGGQGLVNLLEQKIHTMGGKTILVKHYKDFEDMEKTIDSINEFVHKFNENPNNLDKLGIYVADSRKNLTNLLQLMKEKHLDKTANIFGDNRLDIPAAQDMTIFFTGYKYHSSKKKHEDISKYDYVHKLSYDLGLYAGHVLQSENMNKYLNNSDWIEGLSGYFKVNNHVTNRKYDVLKYENGRIKVLEGID